jgi:hypothetical protein
MRHKSTLLVTAQFVPTGIAGIAATMLTGFLLPRCVDVKECEHGMGRR